jgi:hypothetical protein
MKERGKAIRMSPRVFRWEEMGKRPSTRQLNENVLQRSESSVEDVFVSWRPASHFPPPPPGLTSGKPPSVTLAGDPRSLTRVEAKSWDLLTLALWHSI